jgi:hypothetical protein
MPAAIASAVFHGGLFLALLMWWPADTSAGDKTEKVPKKNTGVAEEKPVEKPLLVTKDFDEEAKDSEVEISYNVNREAEVSVPGEVSVNDPIGIPGAQDNPLTSITPAFGSGGGTGGGLEGLVGENGVGTNEGEAGGERLGIGKNLAGTFYGRSGATKEQALINGGGTKQSEAAVARGLAWLARHQAPDGGWSLSDFHRHRHCNCGNRGVRGYPIAATAFGVLPFLGAGHTHKPGTKKDPNPYDKVVKKALYYLMAKQKANGRYDGNMYCHGLATIAMCEAYGLTQDPWLKRSAQLAVNYIVWAQHPAGGWRYGPKQRGDTSVVGWQVMALKSAQMAGLSVPTKTMKKAQEYLDSCMGDDYGYGYFGKGSTKTMTAVGLLCRQYIQRWGPSTPSLYKGVNNILKKNMPVTGKDMYYLYYATQVMHHFGGQSWKEWNDRMREILIREQDQGKDPTHKDQEGSWSPEGDPHGGVGGRLMITSLSILTLEVYYRHLPLYRRDLGDVKDAEK